MKTMHDLKKERLIKRFLALKTNKAKNKMGNYVILNFDGIANKKFFDVANKNI